MRTNGHYLGYIHDGYTLHGYVAAMPRLYPELRFTYRPVLSQNRAVIFRQIASMDDPRREESIAAQAIKAQLIDWDLKNHKGEAVAVETAEILRVQPRLMNRLFRIVMGDEPSDEDPLAAAAERDAQIESDLSAALAGCSPEEADSKNYIAG